MRRRALLFANFLLLGLAFSLQSVLAELSGKQKTFDDSTDPTQANIAEIEADMLQTWQYSQHPFDQEISTRFFDRYLEMLDYSHIYFLQSDMQEFEAYRTNLHVLTLRDHDMTPCWKIFSRFMERANERIQYVTNLLSSEKFEFKGHDRFIVNRHSLAYAKDMSQLKDFWRQELRCEYLEQLLDAQGIEFSGTISNITEHGGNMTGEVTFARDKARPLDYDYFPTKILNREGRALFPLVRQVSGSNETIRLHWPKNSRLTKVTNSIYSGAGAQIGEVHFRLVTTILAAATNSPAPSDIPAPTVTNYSAIIHLNETNMAAINKAMTNRYVQMLDNYKDLESDRVFEMYMNALARAYDPHSDYMGHLSAENFAIQMKLSLFGIGAILQRDKNYCKIVELKEGPAAKSKQIKEGDRIVAVAQSNSEPVDVVGMPLDKIVEMIRGPKGTQVTLTIIPVDAAESVHKEVTLVRDEIKLEDQAAKARLYEIPAADKSPLKIGVIELPSFYANNDHPEVNTTSDVTKLLNRLKKEKVDGIILDLRHNGGGYLEEAIKLTGLFDPQGPVVQTRDPNGEIVTDPSPEAAPLYDGPLVVLTDVFSASASEILTGALQDFGRAVVVGDHSTFGKGTVQTMQGLTNYMDLKHLTCTYDPGELKVTIKKFYRPGGVSTQLQGVVSDINLPSLDDSADVGERSLPNAMPCDSVTSADHLEQLQLNRVKPYLAELQERSQARVAKDKDFGYVREDIAIFRKEQDDKSLSLNMDERMAERKTQTERAETVKKERLSRKKTDEKAFQLTLKNIDSATLESLVTKPLTPRKPVDLDSDDEDSLAEPSAIDPTLEETKRILSDYIELLKKGPALSKAP